MTLRSRVLRQRYWRRTTVRDLAEQTGKKDSELYGRLRIVRKQLQDCIESALAKISND